VFRIGGNTFYDRKNKITMKIPEFKWSGIGLIAQFCGIPNRFPNQGTKGVAADGQWIYGVGFPHPGVECLIRKVDKILSHYSSPTGLGKHMQVLMELMIIEAGVSCQPFTEPYVRYSKLVTHSWLRLLWKKADMLQIKIEINNLPLNLPWVNDRRLMKVLEAEGYSEG
jgi:hypothetical protein